MLHKNVVALPETMLSFSYEISTSKMSKEMWEKDDGSQVNLNGHWDTAVTA